MSLDPAITIFDGYKEKVLTFTTNLGGEHQQMYLLREMMYDDHDLVDPHKIGQRLRKLPALLVFFGTMKDNAEKHLAMITEEYEMWYDGASQKANETYIKELSQMKDDQGKLIAASLKKALTVDQLKHRVMSSSPNEWRERRAKMIEAQDRVALLGRMLEGLHASIRLVQSESTLIGIMMNKGLEEVSSNVKATLNRHLQGRA